MLAVGWDVATELTIRRYRPRDSDRVRELHEVALRDADAFFGDDSTDADLASVESTYLDSGGEFLVGLLDGRIVVMGAFRPVAGPVAHFLDTDDSTGEIKRMRVDPDHQRRGYGQHIFVELERRAREGGYDELVLDTTHRQPGAQRFFENNGFELVRRERIERFEEPFEMLVYRKSLVD